MVRKSMGRDNWRNHGWRGPEEPASGPKVDGDCADRRSMRRYSLPFAGAAKLAGFLPVFSLGLSPWSAESFSLPAGGAASILICVPSGSAYPPAVITESFSLM